MGTFNLMSDTASLVLIPTKCAICGTDGNAKEIYPANFAPEAFAPEIFSARRLPDRIHYRMVRCNECGLLRSDPVAPDELISSLYAKSTFDYGAEVSGLCETYGNYLDIAAGERSRKLSVLEIGCGNGFFLKEALKRGYGPVHGVEPSTAATSAADPEVIGSIACDIMKPGLFPSESFDIICMFQVFDHLSQPGQVLKESFDLLRPGGKLLCINHNVSAVSARILGERSPIIDIEHTYLYDPETMTRIVSNYGFSVERTGAVWNKYSLSYLLRLVPMPTAIKKSLLSALRMARLGNLHFKVPLGNLFLVARKP